MPTSVSIFDDRILNWILTHPYPNYIDIGPGEGKYGRMIKSVFPAAKVIGVEVEARYIDLYDLRAVYDEVHPADALEWFADKESDNFDIVIMGDVLEHLWKSEGLDLLHFLVYRTRYIILTYPTAYKQGAWQGFIHEAHLSTWAHKDFDAWENEHHVSIGDNNIQHNLVIVRGFREL